jgi:transposase-like protein
MEKLDLSITEAESNALLTANPFGLIHWGRVLNSEKDALSFAVHTGLINLSNAPICLCGELKAIAKKGEVFLWRCPQRKCRTSVSMLKNTWFSESRLPLKEVLDLTLHWYFQSPVTSAAGQVGVSKEAAIRVYRRCRNVCLDVLSRDDICIGGDGLHVEIDESHLWTRKYHRGRVLVSQQSWVFGGICRETNESFVIPVSDRKGATLWPIIVRKIAPGTVILSDEARVYKNLHSSARGGYSHFQVNHSLHFVDPDDPNVHTQKVERLWGLLKKEIKQNGVKATIEDGLEQYIAQFLYKRQYLKVDTDTARRTMGIQFQIFLNHVAEIYTGPKDF